MRKPWIAVIVGSVVLVGALTVALVFGLMGGAPLGIPSTGEGAPGAAAPIENDDDFGSVEVYGVLSDGTLDPTASGLTLRVWDTFVRVITPDGAAALMNQYRVGDAPASDTLAYVYQADDPTQWVLAANLATSDDLTQLIATLIHEYAHILSLGVDQLDPYAANCDTLQLDEGCADGSALTAFRDEFWSGYGDEAPTPDNSDADVAWGFYLAHEDDFVSDYAATNVVEDLAETFMTWVINDAPSGTSTIAAKFAFLDAYPEFVAVRDRIRDEFSDDLGLVN